MPRAAIFPVPPHRFQVRKATLNEARRAYLLAALFSPQLTEFVATWLIPMEELGHIGRDASEKNARGLQSQDSILSSPPTGFLNATALAPLRDRVSTAESRRAG